MLLTSKDSLCCSVSDLKYSMLMVMIPCLKNRAFMKTVWFSVRMHKKPSDVDVSKHNFIDGKYSANAFSNNLASSFRATSSLMRLDSMEKSNKTVCTDIFLRFPLNALCCSWSPFFAVDSVGFPMNRWFPMEKNSMENEKKTFNFWIEILSRI